MIVVMDIGKTSGYDPRADVNLDGVINVFDLIEVARNWGNTYPVGGIPSGTTLFFEEFEDTNLAGRGWYDGGANAGTMVVSTVEKVNGNSALEVQFNQGSTTPVHGLGIRHLFTESETIYLSYWVKYGNSWQGSGSGNHPHEFHFLTNEDTDWTGPANTFLTANVEQNYQSGVNLPKLIIKDLKNIDANNINVNLISVTESRAVSGCNGVAETHPTSILCWQSGSWQNGKIWTAPQSGPVINPGQWHFVEAYYQLNSIQGGIGQPDGRIMYYLDGVEVFDYNDVYLRTGQHPNMKFRHLLFAPYIGAGSPITQTFWIDDLTIATGKP